MNIKKIYNDIINDMCTNPLAPSHTTFHQNGNPYIQEWNTPDLILHRIDGPARIKWYSTNRKSLEQWYKNGLRHRVDGPAWIAYNQDETIIAKKYYIYDINLANINEWLKENNMTEPYSEEDVMAIILQWV